MSKTNPLKELFKNFDDAFYLLEDQSFLAIEGLEQQLQQAQERIKELESLNNLSLLDKCNIILSQQATIKLLAERLIRAGKFIGDTTDSADYAAELVEFGKKYKGEMIQFELVVNHWKGGEMDRQTFDAEDEAKHYFSVEWGDSDIVSDHTITMLENGERSIFDDIDT